MTNGRMIAAPMVALAALHVRGMNPIGKRSCEAFTGRGR